jgi:hypothetical protein
MNFLDFGQFVELEQLTRHRPARGVHMDKSQQWSADLGAVEQCRRRADHALLRQSLGPLVYCRRREMQKTAEFGCGSNPPQADLTAFGRFFRSYLSLYNYRWYLDLESGERKYDELEKKIATFPTVASPAITLEGDVNGAPHADPSVYAKEYVGRYEHRNIAGGIGHNLPQEAPEAFAQAVIGVDEG